MPSKSKTTSKLEPTIEAPEQLNAGQYLKVTRAMITLVKERFPTAAPVMLPQYERVIADLKKMKPSTPIIQARWGDKLVLKDAATGRVLGQEKPEG